MTTDKKTIRRTEKRRACAHFHKYRDTYRAVIADKDAEIERLTYEWQTTQNTNLSLHHQLDTLKIELRKAQEQAKVNWDKQDDLRTKWRVSQTEAEELRAERDHLKASAAEVLKAGDDLCEAVWDIGAALGADNTKDAILGRIKALTGERDQLQARVAYLESQETYTAFCDQCAAVRRLECVRQDLEGDIARLTQDIADSRREAVERTRERDEAQQEAACSLSALDAEVRETVRLRALVAEEQQRAREETERLQGLLCERDRKIAEQDELLIGYAYTSTHTLQAIADARLGRLIRAMPFWNLCRHAENSWTVRCLMYGEVNVAFYHMPENALSAAGVVDPLAGGDGRARVCDEEQDWE